MKIFLRNTTKTHVSKQFFQKIVNSAAIILELPSKETANIILIGVKKMAFLNQKYSQKKGATDCLTFAFRETKGFKGDNFAGEIFLSLPYIKKQAKKHKNTFHRELKWVFTHSLLHLYGYNHQTDTHEKKMNAMAKKILIDAN